MATETGDISAAISEGRRLGRRVYAETPFDAGRLDFLNRAKRSLGPLEPGSLGDERCGGVGLLCHSPPRLSPREPTAPRSSEPSSRSRQSRGAPIDGTDLSFIPLSSSFDEGSLLTESLRSFDILLEREDRAIGAPGRELPRGLEHSGRAVDGARLSSRTGRSPRDPLQPRADRRTEIDSTPLPRP